MLKKLLKSALAILRESIEMCVVLFRVMIPIIIVVKILEELGAIKYLARFLEPVMELAGLPGSMGIVWATTLTTNLYGGLIVFFALAPDNPLTVAQVTVLASMMLVAHSMLVEVKIAHKAGSRFIAMFMIRFGGALIFGMILNFVYKFSGTLQNKNILVWTPETKNPTLMEWGFGQVLNLLTIWIVIVILLAVMDTLKKFKLTDVIARLLRPILAPVGIGHEAVNITTIGMILGLTCGAGLIIKEARAGHIGKRDLFFSMALMGLCHSIIEDTLLMAAIGAHFSGIFLGRILFSLFFVFILERVTMLLPESFLDKYLFNPHASGKK